MGVGSDNPIYQVTCHKICATGTLETLAFTASTLCMMSVLEGNKTYFASVPMDMTCSFETNDACFMFSRRVQRDSPYRDIWFDSTAGIYSPITDNTLGSGMLQASIV